MKAISILLTFSFFCISCAYAQSTKGKISYDVYFSTDNPEVEKYIDKFQNSTLNIYFMDGKMRSDFYAGSMMTIQTISVKDLDTTLVLMDGMMGRIAMPISHNDSTQEEGESHRLVPEGAKVELVDETQEIIGHTCKKAVITTEKGKAVIWYAEDIVPAYRIGQYMAEEIPGLPLKLHTSFGGMDLKIVAYKYKDKVKNPEEVFSLVVPKGYTVKTVEEMKALRQGR